MRKIQKWILFFICIIVIFVLFGLVNYPQYFTFILTNEVIDEKTINRSFEPAISDEVNENMKREQIFEKCLSEQNVAWNDCAAGRISFTEWQKRNAEAVFTMYPEMRDPSLNSDAVHVFVNGDPVSVESEKEVKAYINQDKLVMVPLEKINNYLGFETQITEQCIVVSSKTLAFNLKMVIGEKTIELNGNERKFSVAPVQKNRVIYVPAEDYVRCFGSYIWDDFFRTFNIFALSDYNIHYQIRWESLGGLIRIENGKETSLPVSFGEAVMNASIADTVISSQKVIDGKTYLIITFNNDRPYEYSVLYRDDGTVLTYLMKIMTGSSFWIQDRNIYFIRGLPTEGQPEITQLYVTSLEDTSNVMAIDQDFPVIASALTIEQGKLTAIMPDGKKYSVKTN